MKSLSWKVESFSKFNIPNGPSGDEREIYIYIERERDTDRQRRRERQTEGERQSERDCLSKARTTLLIQKSDMKVKKERGRKKERE